jgi:hypothetical protein
VPPAELVRKTKRERQHRHRLGDNACQWKYPQDKSVCLVTASGSAASIPLADAAAAAAAVHDPARSNPAEAYHEWANF